MRKDQWRITRNKYMSLDEVRRLRRACEDAALADLAKGRVFWVRAWSIVDFGLSVGARVAEVAGANVGDLMLNGPEPTVTLLGKGKKVRTVTMSGGLRKHLKEFLDWKRRVGEPTGPEDPLFMNERKKRYSTRTLHDLFKRAIGRAGLPGHFSFHSMRHSFGTYLYSRTKDLRLVQEQLGHSDPSITAVYSHVTPEAKVTAVNGLWDDEEKPSTKGGPTRYI